MAYLSELRVRLDSAKHVELMPPAREEVVASFEAAHSIVLPADYRRFLTELGEGIRMDGEPWLFSLADVELILTRDGTDPAIPFAYDCVEADVIRNVMMAPPAGGLLSDAAFLALQKPEPANGCLTLTDHGDNQCCVLVVTGAERGRMWRTGQMDTPEARGLYESVEDWQPLSFSEWLPFWVSRFLGA